MTSFPVDSCVETAFLLRRCVACRKRVRRLEQNACDECIRNNNGDDDEDDDDEDDDDDGDTSDETCAPSH